MNSQLMWSNLLAYSLQVGLLVGLSGAVPMLLRLHVPKARLLFWQILLATCLILPAAQPWRQQVITLTASVTPAGRPVSLPPLSRGWPVEEVLLAVIALGMVLRGGWLALGLVRLRRYRRHSRPLDVLVPSAADLRTALAPGVALRLSDEVSSPVTFGARRPVVLLPGTFPQLPESMQQAVVCHELLHVARRDWLFTMAEEVVRTVFWFHPAVWWLLGELQLSREQAVDREVVEMTRSRNEYVDALLAIAGATPRLDLAPAPLFLRKRHLKHRVVSILKESTMSKKRLFSALAAALGMLVAASWLVVGTFPLEASPQVVLDADGVSVDAGGAVVAHRAAVEYPEAARRKGVQGLVILEATVDNEGLVTDARVISGPDELRRAALQAVLQWHFAKSTGAGIKSVTLNFRLPAAGAKPAAKVPVLPPGHDASGMVLKRLVVVGLDAASEADLRARLPVREGAALSNQTLKQIHERVAAFDEHLNLGIARGSDPKEVTITVSSKAIAAPAAAPERIRIGGNVQQTKLINKVAPRYPVEAKEQRIQGAVKLQAVIAKTGEILSLEVLSGEPVLVDAAVPAVRQWVYQPTLLNGNPVEVVTQIDVNFTLAK